MASNTAHTATPGFAAAYPTTPNPETATRAARICETLKRKSISQNHLLWVKSEPISSAEIDHVAKIPIKATESRLASATPSNGSFRDDGNVRTGSIVLKKSAQARLPGEAHQLGIDQRSAGVAVERAQMRSDDGQVDEAVDCAQQVSGRGMPLQAELVEQRLLPFAHHAAVSVFADIDRNGLRRSECGNGITLSGASDISRV